MKRRLLSFALVLCMLQSLMPVQVFAAWDEEENAYSITLPIVEEGTEENYQPTENGYSVSTFGLVANRPTYEYIYEGYPYEDPSFGTDMDIIVAEGQVAPNMDASGVVNLYDENGDLAASSTEVDIYEDTEYDYESSSYVTTGYYISWMRFGSLSDLAAGLYTMKLSLDGVAYDVNGALMVVGKDNLMLSQAYLENFYLGKNEFDLRLQIYGIDSEEDLDDFSFQVLDGDGKVIAKTTGAYKDINAESRYDYWHLYAQMLLEEGCTLEQNKKYSLKLIYTGDKDLFDAVGSVTRSVSQPSMSVADFEILNPLTGEVKVTLADYERYMTGSYADYVWSVTVQENSGSSSTVYANSGFAALPEDGTYTFKMQLNGQTVPLTSYGYQFYVRVNYKSNPDRDYSNYMAGEQFENPYYNLNSNQEYYYFYPYYIDADSTKVEFFIEYHQGYSRFTGEGDKVTLERNGTVYATCTDVTITPEDTNNGKITGVFNVPGGFDLGTSKSRRFDICVNGVAVDNVWVSTIMQVSASTTGMNWNDDTFYTNLGVFFSEVNAINSSGKARLVIKDTNGTDILVGDLVSSTESEYPGMVCYNLSFTDEDFAALTSGTVYNIYLRDSKSNECSIAENMTYYGEKIAFDSSGNDWYAYWWNTEEGDTQVEAIFYMDDCRNITREELVTALQSVTLTNSTDGTTYLVTGLTGDGWDGNNYRGYLTLDKALTAGEYKAIVAGVQKQSFSVDETVSEEDKVPYIWEGDVSKYYLYGRYLDATATYTAKLYDGYTCLTPSGFTLTPRVFDSNPDYVYLYYDRSVVDNLEPGEYEMRVNINGVYFDSVTIKVKETTIPIILLDDEDDVWGDSADSVIQSSTVQYEISNIGNYAFVRLAETKEALAEAEFEEYRSNYYNGYTFADETTQGARTLYMQLSLNGEADDPNIIDYTFNLWLCTDGDYDLQVPAHIQGVNNPESGEYTISATIEYPAANVYVSFYDVRGEYAIQKLPYVGATEDGRYEFALTFNIYDSFSDFNWNYTNEDGGSWFAYEDTQKIAVFATDLGENYDNDRYDGNQMGEAVERILIFGDPSYVIVPQFNDGSVSVNKDSYTVYGYATPDKTVTVGLKNSETVLATAQTNEYGYFEAELTGLEDGYNYLTMTDGTVSLERGSVTLIVDTTAPVISSVGFTWGESGSTAVIRWICEDDDVDYFRIYKNNQFIREVDRNINTADVVAAADDGNFFTIEAYDYAGNMGFKTVSTADTEPPTAPTDLKVERASGALTLSWTAATDNVGIAAYRLYIGSELVGETKADTLTCTIPNLKHGTQYTVDVIAVDKAANTSDKVSVTDSTVKLTVEDTQLESAYIVDEMTGKKIPVSFTLTGDSEDFTPALENAWVEYRMQGTEEWSDGYLSCDENVAEGEWDISGSDDGYITMGTYEIRFRAEDSYGCQVYSDPVQVTLLKRDDVVPSTPGAPAAVSHSTTTISFKWTASTDNVAVDHYEIYRDGVKVGTSNTNSYTDTGLEMGKSYAYTVKAVDARNNISEISASVTLSTMVLKFNSVIDLESSYIMEEYKENGIAVWAKFEPEAGYAPAVDAYLEYKGNEGTWVSVALSADKDDVNLFQGSWSVEGNDTGYLPAGDYTVRFKVTDGDAAAYSTEQSVTLKRDEVNPEISNLTLNGHAEGTTEGGKNLTLLANATDNVGVVKVVFSYAKDGSEEFQKITEVTCDGSASYTWDATQLESGKYILKAEAYDLRNNVGIKTAAFILDNTAPAQPTDLTVTGTSRYIHVMWDDTYKAEEDFQGFLIYRAEAKDGEYTHIGTVKSIGYFDTSTSVDADTTYYYKVSAADKYGNETEALYAGSAVLVSDNESPVIGGVYPYDGNNVRRSATLKVKATDNYRLAKAVFSYLPANSDDEWIVIGEDVVESVTKNTEFTCEWSGLAELSGDYKIKVEVYDDSINDVDVNTGFTANAPAVKTWTLTVLPYELPVAPVATAQAGYKTVTLSWTYSGPQETLKRFEIWKCTEDGIASTSIGTAPKGETGTYTTVIPVEGTQRFVVKAVDNYKAEAISNVVDVTSLAGETEKPVAVMLPETLVAAVGVEIPFSAVNSTDNDKIASYDWNFGDKSTGSGARCGHTYTAAGEYTVTLTVTDECGNVGTAQKTITVVDVAGEDAQYSLATISVVNGAAQGTPSISGASLNIRNQDGFEATVQANEAGKAVVVLPKGTVTVSVTADGYVATSRNLEVKSNENGAFAATIALTPVNVSLVDGSLSHTEMTYEEILAAGIDVTDPDNEHVWKFAATLEFVAGASLPFELPVTGYYNQAGDYVGGSGWGWSTLGGGNGWGGMSVGVFPISEHFVLVIYGEAHWLKEMYNVELLVINNSYADDITDCEATLQLPDGLSLAAMSGAAQSATIDLGTIAHKDDAVADGNTAKATWYVRGDKEGEYDLTAVVTGKNPEPFAKTFTTDKPVKVYAGSALKLFITAQDMAYRGEEYHVQFKLQNVSDKDLYNLSFGITGAEQYKVIEMMGQEGELLLTQEDFGDSMTRSIDVLEPGGAIAIDFYTTTWFNSVLELADLGPAEVGYYLTNVFVTTLEGSTTEIPYEVSIEHVDHGTFFEWLLGEEHVGEVVTDVITDAIEEVVPGAGTIYKVYKFVSEDSDNAASRAEITISGGRYTPLNNFLRSYGLNQDVVQVSIDAAEGDFIVSEDGTKITLLGDAMIYVQGAGAGEAEVEVTTYAKNTETGKFDANVHTMKFQLTDAVVEAEEVILEAPEEDVVDVPLAGEIAQITFPHAIKAKDGNLYTATSDSTWTITGDDTTGLSVEGGVLTITSFAKAGEYTVRFAVSDELYAEQTITLTKEEPVATKVILIRQDEEVGTTDTLVLPVLTEEESHTYTAQLLDQYGEEIETEFTWTVSDNTSTAVVENGVVTLRKDSQIGKLTLKVAAGDLSAQVEVIITNLLPDWSGVESALEGTTYTYGDTNSKAKLPVSGTATALETVKGTFSYLDGEAVQNAGEGTITVVFTADADQGEYAGASISKEFKVNIGKKPLTDSMLTIEGGYTYTGQAIVPTYQVADGALMTEEDYTVEVINNVDAGRAAITVKAANDGNYTGAVSKEFVIAKADITGFVTQAPGHTILANDSANTDTASLKLIANGGQALPEKVEVSFGDDLTAELPITWANSKDKFNVKGGTYTYVGTVNAGDNLNAYAGTLTATVTVTPITGTVVSQIPTSVVVAKTKAQNAESYADFKLPASLELSFDNGVANMVLEDLEWNVTLDKLKKAAVGSTTKVTLTSLPEWITMDAPQVEVSITNRYPVNVTVTAPADTTYGSELDEPFAQQVAVDDGVDANGTWTYAYRGTTAVGKTYNSSEKPTQAGIYTVTATLVSDTHAGVGTSESFTIAPKTLTADMLTITGEYTFTGKEIQPTYTVADGELLTAADYVAVVSNNVNAGSAVLTITGENNYQGKVEKTFVIAPASITEVIPTITGKTQVGNTITGLLDVANFAAADFDYSWQCNGEAANGNSQIYILTAAESGAQITLTVTAKENTNYTGTTQVSLPVAVAKVEVSGSVTIEEQTNVGTDGVINAGDTLSVNVVGVEPSVAQTGGTFAWYRNGQIIEGADAQTYVVTAEDEGAVLSVVYTPADNFTGTVRGEIECGKTIITGNLTVESDDEPVVDTMLNATFDTELENGYELVWTRDGVPIKGATGSSYTITDEDQGSTIAVKAVAKDGYTGEILGGSVDVPAAAPDQPEASAAVSSGAVTLKWETPDDNGAPITGYDIMVNGEIVATATADATSCTVDGLENGVEYTFVVVARNEEGDTASAEIKATPKATSGGSGGGGGGAVEEEPVIPELPFDDIERHWGVDFICYAYENGLMNGVGDRKFAPDMNTSRGMIVTILWALENKPAVQNALTFKDVAPGAWYTEAVRWAVSKNIVSGYSDVAFGPDDLITREQLAAILLKYAKYKGVDVSVGEDTNILSYDDAFSISDWAFSGLQWACGEGMIQGRTESTLAPKGNATRAEVATILMRYLEDVAK